MIYAQKETEKHKKSKTQISTLKIMMFQEESRDVIKTSPSCDD